jgi:hypothetical protein
VKKHAPPFECGTLTDAPSSAKNGEAQVAGRVES